MKHRSTVQSGITESASNSSSVENPSLSPHQASSAARSVQIFAYFMIGAMLLVMTFILVVGIRTAGQEQVRAAAFKEAHDREMRVLLEAAEEEAEGHWPAEKSAKSQTLPESGATKGPDLVDDLMKRLHIDDVEPAIDPPDPHGMIAAALARVKEAYPDGSISRVRGGAARDAAKREVFEAIGSDHPAIYGEMLPKTVAGMLHQVGAKAGQRYYDLGSGIGIPAAVAWLLGLNAVGVELVSLRWQVACDILSRLRKYANSSDDASYRQRASLVFAHTSFLELDFSEADIVFANSVSFTPELMAGLAHVAKKMKPGSLVITAKGPHLPGPGFRLVKRFVGPTTWSNTSVWNVHAVESSPSTQADFLAQPEPKLKTLHQLTSQQTCRT